MSKIKGDEIVLRATNNGHYIIEDDWGTTAHASLEKAVESIANSINNKRWRNGQRLIEFDVFISEKVMPPLETTPDTVEAI